MDATTIVHRMPAAFDAEAAGDLKVTVQCRLSTPMYLAIADGHCEAHEGTAEQPELTLTTTDDDFIALFQGELNAMTAFMTGRLKLDGDLMLGQRVVSLFDMDQIRAED